MEINKLSSLKVQISGYCYIIHLISTKGEHMPDCSSELPRIHKTVLKLRISIRGCDPHLFFKSQSYACTHAHTHKKQSGDSEYTNQIFHKRISPLSCKNKCICKHLKKTEITVKGRYTPVRITENNVVKQVGSFSCPRYLMNGSHLSQRGKWILAQKLTGLIERALN